jgi:hypothetical protein
MNAGEGGMDHVVTAAASATGGFSLAILLARWAVAKVLRDVEDLIKQVGALREKLVDFSVRLEALKEHEATLKEHAKKFAYYEGRGKCKTTS